MGHVPSLSQASPVCCPHAFPPMEPFASVPARGSVPDPTPEDLAERGRRLTGPCGRVASLKVAFRSSLLSGPQLANRRQEQQGTARALWFWALSLQAKVLGAPRPTALVLLGEDCASVEGRVGCGHSPWGSLRREGQASRSPPPTPGGLGCMAGFCAGKEEEEGKTGAGGAGLPPAAPSRGRHLPPAVRSGREDAPAAAACAAAGAGRPRVPRPSSGERAGLGRI